MYSSSLGVCKAHQAVADAERAAELAPAWPKPLHRLAQALAGLQRWGPAVAACKRGSALPGQPPHVHASFALLQDDIAVAAALQGDLCGFDGRRLEVGMCQWEFMLPMRIMAQSLCVPLIAWPCPACLQCPQQQQGARAANQAVTAGNCARR